MHVRKFPILFAILILIVSQLAVFKFAPSSVSAEGGQGIVVPQLGSKSYLIPIVNGVINDVQVYASNVSGYRLYNALLSIDITWDGANAIDYLSSYNFLNWIWHLQQKSGTAWNDLKPSRMTVSSTQDSSGCYVIRQGVLSDGSTFTIKYSLPNNGTLKFSLSYTPAKTATYRLWFEVNGLVDGNTNAYVNYAKPNSKRVHFDLPSYVGLTFDFDYSDVSASLAVSEQFDTANYKYNWYVELGNLKAGTLYTVDPTTVSTTAGQYSTALGNSRKLFRDAYGKYIAVFKNANVMLAYCNNDPPTSGWNVYDLGSTYAVDVGEQFGVAAAYDSVNDRLMIAWVGSGSPKFAQVTFSRDSSNNIVGYTVGSVLTITPTYSPAHAPSLWMLHNGEVAAVWGEDKTAAPKHSVVKFARIVFGSPPTYKNAAGTAGSTDTISSDYTSAYIIRYPSIVQRTNSGTGQYDLYAIFGANTAVYGKKNKATWTGSAWTWGTEAYTTATVVGQPTTNYDVTNGVIVYSFQGTTSNTFYVGIISADDTDSDISLTGLPTATRYCPSLVIVGGDYYIFYIIGPSLSAYGNIYYIKRSGGSWSSEIQFTTTANENYPSCKIDGSANRIELIWTHYTGTAYNVYYDYLSLAVADTTPPTYSNIGTNTTKAGQPCKFSVKWTDNVGLSSFIFGWNASGTWQNDTKVTLSGTTAWSNISKVLPLADAVIGWRIWCNDTSNNWNDTGIQVLITSGALVQPTDTAKQTAIFQACVEEAVLTVQTLLASGQLVWGGEWKVSMSELALTSGTQLYWQEHVYTYPQTAVMPSDLKLWIDALYSFPASMSQLASLQPSGEASFTKTEIICQTDSAKALQELIYSYPQTIHSTASLAYWQEHIHEYSQITFHTATITYNVEGIVAFEVTVSFTETVNQNGVLQYWIEGVYVFIKKMTVNETVTYFQELHYPFSTSLTQSGTVQYWQEQAYRIDQPMRSQTALQTYGEGVVLTVQTIKPYESVLYWQEHSRSFQETSSLSIFLQSFGEGISLIVQTVSPTGLVSYVQEQIYTYPQTVGQSELNQVASEGIYTLSQTLKPSEQHIYGGEGVSVIIQTVKPSEMTVYMQEQKYSFIEQTVQTYSLQYWIEGIQQFYETFMETAKSADMFKYWMELSQAFYEPFKPSASTSYSAEALSVIVQTVKPSEITIYWQEQVYVYPQTAKLPESHPIAGEGVYALSQTLKPSDQTLYGGEGQNIMVQTITSTGSVKYWQEQQYFTGETAKTSSILSVLKEMAETFITQIDTVHLTESPFWLFEGPGAPPFVPPAPSVTPSIVPPVQPTPTPVLPYRYAPVIAGSIIAMAVIGIVAYEKSKPPSTSSRKVAAVWSKRQTENSKKAPPKIKRENRFQTVKVKRKNRFRTVED